MLIGGLVGMFCVLRELAGRRIVVVVRPVFRVPPVFEACKYCWY